MLWVRPRKDALLRPGPAAAEDTPRAVALSIDWCWTSRDAERPVAVFAAGASVRV